MRIGLWIRLSLMMFLQYVVWGVWLPGIGQYMGDKPGGINLDPGAQGWVFTVYGFGAILGPFIIGQLADRYFSAERVMAVCHLLGGFLLMGAAYATSFWPLFGLLFLYCNLYMPTMGLSNSITFRALGPNNQSYFPYIRLWGTIGWIVVGLGYGEYLRQATIPDSPLRDLFGISIIGAPTFRDCLRIPAVISIIYALYCLTLPHTPPSPASEAEPIDKDSALEKASALMRDRAFGVDIAPVEEGWRVRPKISWDLSFTVLLTVTGLVGIMLAFYFGCETFFLTDLKIPDNRVVQYMTIGQGAELGLMFLVPLAVQKLGIKKTMLIGASAWAVRFGLSAYGQPQWLMISTIALHGFAFGFFFVPAQMYVDEAAPTEIKSTAQNLLVFVVYGLGTILGSILSGYVRGAFLIEGTKKTNWSIVWLGPTILTTVCLIAFALLFRDKLSKKPAVEKEALAV